MIENKNEWINEWKLKKIFKHQKQKYDFNSLPQTNLHRDLGWEPLY